MQFLKKSILFTAINLFIIQLFFVSQTFGDQKVILKINEAGFEPKQITINQGDDVNFVNEGLIDHWPASNIHPTHGIYPEFDPKNPIKPGLSWVFKFEKPGTFKFHDHLFPTLSGEIKVESKSSEKQAPLKKNTPLGTLFKKLYYLIFPLKLKVALESLDSLKTANGDFELEYWVFLIGGKKYMQELVKDSKGGSLIDCHQEAHLTGRKAYKIEGKEVFKKIDYNCHSGYLHGALEAFMSTLEGRSLIEEVEKLCNGFNTGFSRFECLHGIGHGLTAYSDYDIPGALNLCKKFSTENAMTSCFGGVFMENIMVAEGKGAVKDHQTKWVSKDPHFPCNGLDKDYNVQYNCYQMQTSRMLQLRPKDYNYLRQECLKVSHDMVEVCFRSMGRDVAGQTLRNPSEILKICQTIPQKYFTACIKGALNVIIDFWGENIVDQPQKLCEILNRDNKPSCFSLLGNRLKGIFENNTKKINEICNKVEKEYLNICLNGSTQT